LIDAGRAADEPAAVIEWGTTASQRTVVGTLETIADLAERESIRPPATTVVGPVIGLRDAVAWFENRPLFGSTVVVTRPAGARDRLGEGLEEMGARVLRVPVIEIVDPPSFEELDAAIRELSGFEWVAFASPNAVDRFFARLAHEGRDARALGSAKVAAVGKGTATSLARHGVAADLVPEHATGVALADALGPGHGRVLLPRPVAAPRALPEALAILGWEVVEAGAYETRPVPSEPLHADVVGAGEYDLVAFASPSAVDAFVDRFGVPDASVACIGSTTADAARARGLVVDVAPDEHGPEALVEAIAAHLRK
jgi:uroporphyrinogen III methyltransferase/synthase